MSIQKVEEAATFVDFVRGLVGQALQETQRVEWARVTAKHVVSQKVFFDVVLESDESVVVPNVLNQSDYDIVVGDRVVVFIIEDSLGGAYIIGVCQQNSLETSGSVTVSETTSTSSGLQPQQIFTLELSSPLRVVSKNGNSTGESVEELLKTDLYCVAEGRFQDGRSSTVWWKIGQPFDGAVYSAWLTLMASRIKARDWGNTVPQRIKDGWTLFSAMASVTAKNGGFLVVPVKVTGGWTFTSALPEDTRCLVRVRTNSTVLQGQQYGLQVLDVIFENYA